VPEYDAFGRPIGEDPVAALRGATAPPDAAPVREPLASDDPAVPWPVAPPEHAPVRRPVAPDDSPARGPIAPPPAAEPPARPVFVRPRRRRRGMAALIVFVALVSVGAVVVPALVGVATDEVTNRLDDLVPPAVAAPVGLEGKSLIRRANFGDAVATLRAADLGRPLQLRLAPERIDATLVDARGNVHQVQLTFDGDLQELGTGAGAAGAPTIRFDRIDPSAPERLVRRGARRVGRSPGSINYLVLGSGPGLPWGAYFKRGEIVQGDARGRPRRVF
jgi:hypothetical protein